MILQLINNLAYKAALKILPFSSILATNTQVRYKKKKIKHFTDPETGRMVRALRGIKPGYSENLKSLENVDEVMNADDFPLRRTEKIKACGKAETPHVFHDATLDRFTNMLMIGGQKFKARQLLDSALCKMKRIQLKKYFQAETETERASIETNPLAIFHKAVENATPVMLLTPFFRGGVIYQVPTPISDKHAKFKAMKWFVRVTKDHKIHGHTDDLLCEEFLGAYNKEGRVYKTKLELHKQCEQNRAYAYYRVMGRAKR